MSTSRDGTHMGFWDWLTRRNPLDVASPWADNSHLERVTLAHLYDIDESNLPIDRAAAMRVPTIARARNLISAGIAGMPLMAHNKNGTVETSPAIVQQPDPGLPALTTWTWIVDELMFHGSAWLYVLEDDPTSHRARRVRVLPQTKILFDQAGEPYGFKDRPLPGRWIRIDGPHEGLLTYGRHSIRAALSIEAAYRRAAEMPIPVIELHQTGPTPKVTPAERDEIIASWVAARKSRTGAVAYTSSNIEAKPHGMPAETLLVAARDAAALDMARLCGIPAWAADVSVQGSSLTYSNIVDRNRELVDFSFAPYMQAIEARFSMDDILPRGTWARFATDVWLRGDLKARAEAYAAAKAVGFMTDEDIAAAERGHPREG